jgi:hypothetical protein
MIRLLTFATASPFVVKWNTYKKVSVHAPPGAAGGVHSALEIAKAFEVSSQVIAGILGAAERRLARLGLTPIQMRAAARREAELHPPPGARSLPESKQKSWSGHRTHR